MEIGFDGMLLIGAIVELLREKAIDGVDNLVRLMLDFQKQLRYGLPDPKAILFYEMGFSDRVVAIDLSLLFEDIQPNKKNMVQALKDRREQVFEKLNLYPEYFSEVYRVVAT